MMTMLVRILAMGGLLTLASAADAQGTYRSLPVNSRVGIVLPPAVTTTDGRPPAASPTTRRVLEAVETGLQKLAYTVVPANEVLVELAAVDVVCEHAQSCAPAVVLDALKLDAVLLVAVWEDRTPGDISIEITTEHATGTGRGRLDDDALHQNVLSVLANALLDLERGGTVELRVDAIPEDATVTVDGEAVEPGVVVTTKPGRHEIVVSHPARGTATRIIEIERGYEGTFIENVLLPAEDGTPITVKPTETSSAPTPLWDYILGGGLIAGGVGLAVAPVLAETSSNDCELRSDGGCRPTDSGLGSRVQLGIAAGMLAGGIVVLATTPIYISTDGDRFHATVRATF